MQKKRSKVGVILFLCLYAVMVIAILAVIFHQMKPLSQRLSDYEAAQLEHKCSEIFRSLFDEPDWEKIYDLSGTEDTPFEGAQAYAAYMEAKVGGAALTFRETQCGQADTHRYDVLLDTERIAAFTVNNQANADSALPQWQLQDVEVFFTRSVRVTVEKKPEYTVYINDVALDDSFTIRIVTTNAEDHLPEGVHGYRMEQQYVTDLLVMPQVRVLDENGEAVAMNCENGIYTLASSDSAEMTEAEKTLARNAAVADAKFSMRRITATELSKYFDSSTQVYSDIVNNPLFIQSHKGFAIDESSISVGEYCRYSEDMFSAKVRLKVNITRKDDTIKVYELDKTYFFRKNESGTYLVVEYTNESVQKITERLRLTFVLDDGQQSMMVDKAAQTVTVPQITAGDGKTFLGWATEAENGGKIIRTVRILPDGTVLGELESMVVYPVYADVSP